MKKLIFAFLFLIIAVEVQANVNIAYKTSNGKIYELDNGNVDRFVDPASADYDVNVTTLSIKENKINTKLTDFEKIYFDTATKTVEKKTNAEIQAADDATKNRELLGDIYECYAMLSGLIYAKTVETDVFVIAAIDDKIIKLNNRITTLKGKLIK